MTKADLVSNISESTGVEKIAVQAALETKSFGIDKIPQKGAVENNGSYFYNMVDFRQI